MEGKLKMIKVSVIIPVFNAEKYLSSSLECILNQSLKEIEVICVDDGSSDTSQKILKDHQTKDSRVTILQQDNKGAGAARNKGIKSSSGEYLYFFDADDLCDTNLLEKTYKLAKENKADIVAFNGEKFWEDGKVEAKNGFNKNNIPSNSVVFSKKDIPDTIIQTVNVVPWNKILRSEFVKNNNIKFEEISSSNDITFSAVCNAMADRIVCLDENLYKYRVGISGSITSKKSKNLNNIKTAVESAERQIKALPYYDEIKNSLRRFIIENLIYPFGSSDNIPDFDAPIVKDFYNYVHIKFNESDYIDCYSYLGDTSKSYKKFLEIKNSDYDEIKINRNKKIIVSMTSFPARIHCVPSVLKSIFNQSELPYKIVLYLASEQFINKENDLPQELVDFEKEGKIEIRLVDDDIRPHKKYFYAIQEFPNDLIITIDDDLIYNKKMIECLHQSYYMNPNCVSGVRSHIIAVDDNKNILPYEYWIKTASLFYNIPNHQMLITGGAGTLYPANLFQTNQVKELLNLELIKKLSLNADDLWLKAIELVNDIPVVLVDGANFDLTYVPGSQDIALCKTNINEKQNDKQLQSIRDWMCQKYNEDYFINKILKKESDEINSLSREFLYSTINSLKSKIKYVYKNNCWQNELERVLRTARIDIINYGSKKNDIEVLECSDLINSFKLAEWGTAEKGKYYYFESQLGQVDFSFKIKISGLLKIYLRSKCLRNDEKITIPIGIGYSKFLLNGNTVFSVEQICTHDNYYLYTKNVKDGDVITCHIEWNNVGLYKRKDIIDLEKENLLIRNRNLELERKNNNILKLQKEKEKELFRIKNSLSIKVGRAITFIPRKIRGAVRILHKKGVKGLLKRICRKK